MKIIGIRPVPKWKFWKIDQWEVTVENSGKTKTVSIYATYANEKLFLEHVAAKVLHGTQWTPLPVPDFERLVGREI